MTRTLEQELSQERRNAPATHEQSGSQEGENIRGSEFADEEQQESEARVFRHVAGHEFRFSDRHIERCHRQLGLNGDEEDEQSNDLGEEVGVAEAAEAEDKPPMREYFDALAQPAIKMPITETELTASAKKMPVSKSTKTASGPKGTTNTSKNVLANTTYGAATKTFRSARAGTMSSF